MVSQILNFGLPAPIDIQVSGAIMDANRDFAAAAAADCGRSRASTDLRIQQPFDQPKLHVDIDRTKARAGRITTQRDVAGNVLVSLERKLSDRARLSGSTRRTESATTSSRRRRSTRFDSLQDLRNIPSSGPG